MNLIVDDGLGGATGNCYAGMSNVTYIASTNYVMSFYAKADQSDWAFLNQINYAGNYATWFDLVNGVVGTTPGANVNAAGMIPCGNGVYRCWMQFTSDAVDTSGGWRIGPAPADNNNTITRDGTNSILHWGSQIELCLLNAGPTTYARTNGATITRNGEYDTIADITGRGIGSAQGTLYVDAAFDHVASSGYESRIDDGSNANRIYSFHSNSTGNLRQASILADTVNELNINDVNPPIPVERVFSKYALRWVEDDCAQYMDGSADGIDPVYGPTDAAYTRVIVGSSTATSGLNGVIAEYAVFTEGLPDSDLIDISANGSAAGAFASGSGGGLYRGRKARDASLWYQQMRLKQDDDEAVEMIKKYLN